MNDWLNPWSSRVHAQPEQRFSYPIKQRLEGEGCVVAELRRRRQDRRRRTADGDVLRDRPGDCGREGGEQHGPTSPAGSIEGPRLVALLQAEELDGVGVRCSGADVCGGGRLGRLGKSAERELTDHVKVVRSLDSRRELRRILSTIREQHELSSCLGWY